MDLHEVFATWRAKHARPGWTPVCRFDGALDGGQFGGSPRIPPGETWPMCGVCKAPLQLFVQLPTARVPRRIQGDGGWLQVFECTVDGCPSWEPFGGANLVRLIPGAAPITPHPGGEPFPTRAITGWTELVEYPHNEDHEELGLTYKHDHPRDKTTATCPALGLVGFDIPYQSSDQIAVPARGDKLGGWPWWHMSAEYPSCPRCAGRMAYLLQLDSEDHLPYNFGDGGTAHVTQCPSHPEVLAYGWERND